MRIYKILIISIFLTTLSYSDIRSQFPSYSYILTEFDIEESFIDNPEFKNFVRENHNEYRERYIAAVNRGGLIIPTLKEMMYERGISPIFLYLSMVESAFNPEAVSRTGAGGLWQFVKVTGKELNLRVGKNLDERFDPIRSTDAAVRYLYRINNNLNRWYLTAMAYNCGNGCVNKSIRRAGTKDLGVLISSRNNYIKPETKKYIQKILLMAMIGENYLFKENDRVGDMIFRLPSDRMTPVPVRSGEKLSNLASILNMNKVYLEKINAHLKNGQAPFIDGYKINIPTSKVPMFNARYARKIREHRKKYTRR
jgi:membrane-bound lytic murein transglycosylase D